MEDRRIVILINKPNGDICTIETPCAYPWVQGTLAGEEVTIKVTDTLVAEACKQIQDNHQRLETYLRVLENFLGNRSAEQADVYTAKKLVEKNLISYVLGLDELKIFEKFPSKEKSVRFRKEFSV